MVSYPQPNVSQCIYFCPFLNHNGWKAGSHRWKLSQSYSTPCVIEIGLWILEISLTTSFAYSFHRVQLSFFTLIVLSWRLPLSPDTNIVFSAPKNLLTSRGSISTLRDTLWAPRYLVIISTKFYRYVCTNRTVRCCLIVVRVISHAQLCWHW